MKKDGTVEDIIAEEQAGDDVQLFEGIVSPGFVNCHCHLELSHLKGLIDEGTGLAHFVQEVVKNRKSPEDSILQSITDAEQEMYKNGIVAVGDICNTTYSISHKEKSLLHYHNFIEVMGSDPAVAERNFELFEKVYDAFIERLASHTASITPHAPYSVSDDLWEKIIHHKSNDIKSIHNQETAAENEWFQTKTGGFVEMFRQMKIDSELFIPSGSTSLQTFLPKFLPQQQLLLVHNVYTSQGDISFAQSQRSNVYWCLCPNANLYISGAMPPVAMFVKNNCNMVLGTDSLASNRQLSIWDEIKSIQTHFPNISIENILQWATLYGAEALRLNHMYGSFEKGKRPGVIYIDRWDRISRIV